MKLFPLLNDPMFLFGVMIAAQLLSVIAQWGEARRNGSDMAFTELLTYWPQLLIGLGTSVTAFIAMHESGTLNIASVIGIGGIVNKFSDIIASRRTKAITDSIPADTDHEARK